MHLVRERAHAFSFSLFTASFSKVLLFSVYDKMVPKTMRQQSIIANKRHRPIARSGFYYAQMPLGKTNLLPKFQEKKL